MIKVGDKIPSAKLRKVTPTGVEEVSSDDFFRYGSGICAQTNIAPCGLATGQPIRASPSQSASRRD